MRQNGHTSDRGRKNSRESSRMNLPQPGAYLLLPFLLTILGGASAQVQIRHNTVGSGIRVLPDLLNLTLENQFPQAYTIQIKFILAMDSAGTIGEAVSKIITLQPGLTIIGPDMHNQLSFRFNTAHPIGNSLSQQPSLPAGKYNVCYQVINPADNGELASYCLDIEVTDAPDLRQPAEVKDKAAPLTFHGSTELLFNYSSHQSAFTTLPPMYASWTVNPQLTLFDVPVSGRLFLTTLQSPGQQNMNSFTLQFDANQFRELLKARLLQFLNKNKALSKIGGIDFSSYLGELENINGILKNENVLQELNQLQELDSLQQLVSAAGNISGEIKNTYTRGQEQYNGWKEDFREKKNLFTGREDSVSVTDTLYRWPDSTGIVQLPDSLRKSYRHWKDSLSTWKDSLQRMQQMLSGKADSMQQKIQGYIDDPSQLGEAGLESLRKRIKALEWLESKRKYYDELMERKQKIEAYARKFGLMDSSGNISVNTLTNNIDVSKFNDPGYVYNKLKSNKLLRKLDKILHSVKSLSIGMSTPTYSQLTLNGMAINGFSVEVEPYSVYAAFTYGETQNPVLSANVNYASYKRNLIGGKFGYGKKEKSHIHISILSSTDDTASIQPRDSVYLYQKLPQDNKVISVDGQLHLFKNKLVISAEFSGSQTIKDISGYSTNNIINSTALSDPSDWFVNILTQRHDVNKATVDYAVYASIEGTLFKDKTTVSCSFRRVGPNYYAFGLPFLIRDMMSIELKFSQKLWKNRIMLSGFIRRNNDNLNGQKPITTDFYTYGLDFSMKIPKWPSLKAVISPLMLQNDSSVFNLMSVTVNSVYSFKARKLQNMVSATFLKQFTFVNDSAYRFDFTNLNLNYTVTIKKGPNLQFNSGYFGSENNSGRKDTWTIGLASGMTFFKIWNNQAGGNLYVNQHELKWGAYYQTSISLLKYLTFSLRLENNQFNTYAPLPGLTDYTQLNLRTLLTAKW